MTFGESIVWTDWDMWGAVVPIVMAVVAFLAAYTRWWYRRRSARRDAHQQGLYWLRHHNSSKETEKQYVTGRAAKLDYLSLARSRVLGERLLTSQVVETVLTRKIKGVEVYSEPQNGLSTMLAQAAWAIFAYRPVIYCDWSALETWCESTHDTFKLTRRFGLTERRRLHRPWWMLRTPVLVIDAVPSRGSLSEKERDTVCGILDDLKQHGIHFILGVRRDRRNAEDKHIPWLTDDTERIFQLKLDKKEINDIAISWLNLAGLEPTLAVGFRRRNRKQYKSQLFAMLTVLWYEIPESDRYLSMSPIRLLIDEFEGFPEDVKLLVRWVALAQLLGINVPEDAIKKAFDAQLSRNVLESTNHIIRHDIEKSSIYGQNASVYHMGGPVLAAEILKEFLSDESKYIVFLKELVGRTLTDSDASKHYWRWHFDRMMKGYGLYFENVNNSTVALAAYQNVQNRFFPPNDMGVISTIAWAATLRKLGAKDQSWRLYLAIWESTAFEDTLDRVARASLFIGISRLALQSPELVDSHRVIDRAISLAKEFEAGGPRLTLGVATALASVCKTNEEILKTPDRDFLLAKAEILARAVISREERRKKRRRDVSAEILSHAQNFLGQLLENRFSRYEKNVPPNYQKTVNQYEAMVIIGMTPNDVMFNKLIKSAPNYQNAMHWYEVMVASCVVPNEVTTGTLADRAPDYHTAQILTARLRSEGAFRGQRYYAAVFAKAPADADPMALIDWYFQQDYRHPHSLEPIIKIFSSHKRIMAAMEFVVRWPQLPAAKRFMRKKPFAFRETINRFEDDPVTRPSALYALGVFYFERGEMTKASNALRQSLAFPTADARKRHIYSMLASINPKGKQEE